MNAERNSLISAIAADPLMSVRIDGMADLAFGSFTADLAHVDGGHLAILTADALELDLDDPMQREFGGYELQELIGEGGMGVVYRAYQSSLDREVAVKLLAAGPWASKSFIERFQREAQNAARMQHPNIVAIYEVSNAADLHFFSMQLVKGPSLARELKEKSRFAPRAAAALVRTVAEAVDYAHRLGVLHLDLKPANVLLDENSIPHVADFGLAPRLEQGLVPDTDEVSGTPSYMAPEQARGKSKEICQASDIWGLGAILYELVTGKPPFLGDSPQQTLKLVLGGKLKSPRELMPDLPRDLEAVILKCMEPEVGQRYQSARALADDLDAFIDGRMVKARPLNALQRSTRWARREPKLAAAALIALAALFIGLTATTQQWRRAEQQRLRAESNALVSSELSWKGQRESALRMMDDGRGFEALPLLAKNIEEQQQVGREAMIERREVGMILNEGVTLIDRMIIPDAIPITTSLSADGSLLAIGLNDMTVRWYDTATLTEKGRVDMSELPNSVGEPLVPMFLRFVDDHTLLVTLLWFEYQPSPTLNDTYPIDLDHATVSEPPAQFENFAHSVYSADARYALLFDKSGQFQFWQTDPWRPLSQKASHAEPDMPWVLTRDARTGMTMSSDRSHVQLFDPRNLMQRTDLLLPRHVPFTACRENNAGTQIAFGDSEGGIFLVDLPALTTRRLPAPAGASLTWLAYSEDDAWLVAARKDGTAYAFDVASGRTLHSSEIHEDFELRAAAISHADRTVLLSGEGDAAIWRLPNPGLEGVEATRIIANPTRSESAAIYWSGVALQAGLLVTADMNGEVRLWRLPRDSTLPVQAPTNFAEIPSFDGEHVVDIAFNRLRVATVSGKPATVWVELPQPIGFAQLVDDARTLVATSGNRMYVFDATTMKPRYAPVELVGNPQRLAVDSKGTVAILSFGHNTSAGFEEQLRSFDLARSGTQIGETSVVGPLRQLDFSPDAKRVVTTGTARGSIDVFDSHTLETIGKYPNNSSRPVLWSAFTGDGTQLWMVTRDVDSASGRDTELIRWNLASQAVVEKRRVPGIPPIGVTTIGDTPLLAAIDRLLLDPGTEHEKSSPRLYGGEPTTVFAFSHDHRLIAHAYGRYAQIYDAATLEPIGPPLATNMRSLDDLSTLAFSPDDRSLIGLLTMSRHLLIWRVAADERATTEVRRDADLLASTPRGMRVLQIADVAQRARLRERDPGRRIAEERPQTAAARMIDGFPLPARAVNLSPLLLDLTDFYNIAPDSIRHFVESDLPVATALPWGNPRLDGIDFDVRGALELRYSAAGDGVPQKVTGIRVPPVPIAALHVLMYAPSETPVSTEVDYAYVHLHYRDGSDAVLPIRTQREVPGWTQRDRPVPIGWAEDLELTRLGLQREKFDSNPRLSNPHPERIIASIDLETGHRRGSQPIFFAVTAEPVIASDNSRIDTEAAHTTPL